MELVKIDLRDGGAPVVIATGNLIEAARLKAYIEDANTCISGANDQYQRGFTDGLKFFSRFLPGVQA
jgi:ABC-type uncharacterized transport system substrate-binding protein